MYQIKIHKNGDVIAEGQGRNWEAAATRLYNAAMNCKPKRSIQLQGFHGTKSPIGSHTVQFGYYLPKASAVALDSTVIVQVQEA